MCLCEGDGLTLCAQASMLGVGAFAVELRHQFHKR